MLEMGEIRSSLYQHSVMNLRFFPEVLDLVLISAEIASELCEIVSVHRDILAHQFSVWFFTGSYYLIKLVNPWAPAAQVILTAALYIQMAALILLWVFRMAAVVRSKGRRLLKPFDLFSGCRSSPRSIPRRALFFGQTLWTSSSRYVTMAN